MEDASMTKTQRVRLIAVLIFFSAISLPGSSYAQQTVSGTWIGFELYDTTTYFDSQILGETSASNIWTTFNLELVLNTDPYTIVQTPIINAVMSIGGVGFPPVYPITTDQSYSPQGAAASVLADYYPIGIDTGNFDVSYQAILPDGFIDTTGGFAVADMNLSYYNFQTGTTTDTLIEFQGEGVPEPSSLVLAASGILMVSIFAWIRGFTGR
jgi:hypothetical protein